REPFVVRVNLRPALVANAVEPGSAGRHVVVLARRLARLARRELVGVARHVPHAVVAHALGLRAALDALPESVELWFGDRVVPRREGVNRDSLRVVIDNLGLDVIAVAVADLRVADVAVGVGLVVWALARHRPLRLGADALSFGRAEALRLGEVE